MARPSIVELREWSRELAALLVEPDPKNGRWWWQLENVCYKLGAIGRNVPMPQHVHDCPDCRFLGTYRVTVPDDGESDAPDVYWDLYLHPTTSSLGFSIIGRFSSVPSENVSMPSKILEGLRFAQKPTPEILALLHGYKIAQQLLAE